MHQCFWSFFALLLLYFLTKVNGWSKDLLFSMQTNPAKKSMLQKQIPTILGILVLVVALVAGVFFLGEGPGVFAPRATPETTPKKIKITNVTDSGFTISFLTDESTAGFIKYGESASETTSQTSDDRDQLTGTIGNYQTHHITVRGLKPGTKYFYTIGTGSRASFDNSGQPFELTTAKRAGAPSAAKTAYGSVVNPAGGPAEGSMVYVALPGVGEMSSLVKSSGSYAIALSNARTADGSSYAEVTDGDTMSVLVQGPSSTQTSSFNVTVEQSQPIATVTLGQTPDGTTTAAPTDDSAALTRDTPAETKATTSADTQDQTATTQTENTTGTGGTDTSILSDFGQSRTNVSSPSPSPSPSAVATSSAQTTEPQVIDLDSTQEQIISSGTPTIKGKAVPNVVVSIEVNSETQIQQQLIADENGNFELDIEALKQQLEPGEHTATYSYTDPNTGETVTKTVSFVVEEPANGTGGSSTLLAQANTSPSPTPFGSGNPVSQASPSPSASASGSADLDNTKGSTRSGMPATNSAVPVSGSVGTTFALLLGGFFFITAGMWSYWLSREYNAASNETDTL
jgi:hypothetical protein